jgi:hypothetical protein
MNGFIALLYQEVKSLWQKKFNKTGGTISGQVKITEELRVGSKDWDDKGKLLPLIRQQTLNNATENAGLEIWSGAASTGHMSKVIITPKDGVKYVNPTGSEFSLLTTENLTFPKWRFTLAANRTLPNTSLDTPLTFTASAKGDYFVSWKTLLTGGSADSNVEVRIYKNGTMLDWGALAFMTAGKGYTFGDTMNISMEAGDTVSITLQSFTSNMVLRGATNGSYLEVTQLTGVR